VSKCLEESSLLASSELVESLDMTEFLREIHWFRH